MSGPLLQPGESIPSNLTQDQLQQVFQERMQGQPSFFSQLFGNASRNLQQSLPFIGGLAMGQQGGIQQQDLLAQLLMPFLNMQGGMNPGLQMVSPLFGGR